MKKIFLKKQSRRFLLRRSFPKRRLNIKTPSVFSSLLSMTPTGCFLSIIIILIIAALTLPALLQSTSKPAIYLYPEKPTRVNINLDKSIDIDINIPKYISDKGWNVMAYPDGKIVDLQPGYTDCKKIDSNKFGLEYLLGWNTVNQTPAQKK